jgi:predicted small metal-binding protein
VTQSACGDVAPGGDARWRAEDDDELCALAAVPAHTAHQPTRVPQLMTPPAIDSHPRSSLPPRRAPLGGRP